MTDCRLHYRGEALELRALPVLPAVGHYLRHAGALWVVEAVVVEAVPEVYAVRVGDCRAAELVEAWAAWAEPAAVPPGEMYHSPIGPDPPCTVDLSDHQAARAGQELRGGIGKLGTQGQTANQRRFSGTLAALYRHGTGIITGQKCHIRAE